MCLGYGLAVTWCNLQRNVACHALPCMLCTHPKVLGLRPSTVCFPVDTSAVAADQPWSVFFSTNPLFMKCNAWKRKEPGASAMDRHHRRALPPLRQPVQGRPAALAHLGGGGLWPPHQASG